MPYYIDYPAALNCPWLVSVTSTRHLAYQTENAAGAITSLCETIPVQPRIIVYSNQIHEDRVAVISKKDYQPGICRLEGFDAMISSEPGIVLNILTADCLPVFFADTNKHIVGIAHCGWKGSYKRLTERVVTELCSMGCRVEDIHIWFGPAICRSCYEISPELVETFTREFGDILHSSSILVGRHLGLRELNIHQALQQGIPYKNISHEAFCTRCNNALFYSYRAEERTSNRIISSIMIHELPATTTPGKN